MEGGVGTFSLDDSNHFKKLVWWLHMGILDLQEWPKFQKHGFVVRGEIVSLNQMGS